MMLNARTKEAIKSALGVLVYSLVAILLRPMSTRDELDKAASQLAATERELYRRYRKLQGGEGQTGDSRPLRMQELQQFNQFSQALTAAQTDTCEVHEVRQQRQQVRVQRERLMEALRLWRESFSEIQDLDLAMLMPDVDALGEEVDSRFGELSDQDGEHFYRLLGAYRGLSEAAIANAVTAEGIECNHWRDSRFRSGFVARGAERQQMRHTAERCDEVHGLMQLRRT